MKFQNLFWVAFVYLLSQQAFANKKTLVLQYEVSHTRNIDQISLIFRQSSVDLVVNTSSWQKEGNPQLGRFKSPLTPELSVLKIQVQLIHESLAQSVPVLSLLNLPSQIPEPKAPVLWIGNKKIKESSPYFDSMARIIYQVWQSAQWACVECASYKKRRNKIVRLRIHPELKKTAQTSSIQKKLFSKKELSCVSKNSGRIECVDPQFGIFEL